jgi:virginiamycin A acetyltransferase
MIKKAEKTMPVIIGRNSIVMPPSPFLTAHLPNELIIIGNFTGLAEGVKIFGGVHHYTGNVAAFPMKILHFHKFYELEKDVYAKGPTIIGNDVLITYNAMVLSGVTIGDGAIIGAGAVVTKNVPPYAIVAGNPARVIRYRFSDEQIKALLKIRWWDWSDQKIKEFEEYFYDVDTFIKKALERMESEERAV